MNGKSNFSYAFCPSGCIIVRLLRTKALLTHLIFHSASHTVLNESKMDANNLFSPWLGLRPGIGGDEEGFGRSLFFSLLMEPGLFPVAV